MRGASWANMQSREKSVFSVIGEVGWYRSPQTLVTS